MQYALSFCRFTFADLRLKYRPMKEPQHILKLGTRSSNLATTQSRHVADMLERKHPGLKVDLIEITTTGDEVRDKPLQSFGGAGVFVKELENALQARRVDIAVHSLKDMPTKQPADLVIAAMPEREDPRDVAVVRGNASLKDLPAGSVIGSGSLRRRAQLKTKYPQLEFAEIRGNVDTRLRKVREGQFAGSILACAGLKRLSLLDSGAGEITFHVLPYTTMLPAPGQGALAIECRSDDLATRRLLGALHSAEVEACVEAERVVLEALGGGCHLPLGALGTVEKGLLKLQTFFGLPDASAFVEVEQEGSPADPRELGMRVAQLILSQGGREILARL